MKNYKKNIRNNRLWMLFLACFTMNLLFVLVASILKSENHLPASKMVILPTVIMLCFIIVGSMREKINLYLANKNSLFLVGMFLYGFVLYLVAVSGRCVPVHDQEAVYQGALYFAGLSEEISWEYFARCNNNIFPALILGYVFKIGYLVGITDPYYFAVFVNVLQVLIAMYCVFRLCMHRNNVFSAWTSFLLLVLYVPIVGHTLSLYTDSMSFCFGIVCLYLWEKNCDETNKKLYWLKNILIGILMGIAATIKITSTIVVIALLIYSLLKKNRSMICKTVCIILIAIFIIGICNYITTLLPCEQLRNSYGTPKLGYWIGIGLKGNGGYVDNQSYSIHLKTIYGMEDKVAWSTEYIWDNIYEFWNKDHLIQKLRYNFANGGMGCSTFIQTLDSENLLYQLMHYNGKYYWRYSMITTAYMYTNYALIIIGMVVNFIKKKPLDVSFAVSVISIFGIMFYLMLFEANNRQLYNHLPMFVLAAACALDDIWGTIFTKRKFT